MGIIVDFTKIGGGGERMARGQSAYHVARRIVLLEQAGFGEAEVETMKFMRLYPHAVRDDRGREYWSSAVSKFYRRKKAERDRLARAAGISRGAAAKILRDESNKAVKDWHDLEKTGLPPDYDPIVEMGYAKYA